MSRPGTTTLGWTLAATAALCLLASPARGVWPRGGGGVMDDHGVRVVTATSGNTYALGTFRGAATFGLTPLNSSGGSTDLFVAAFDLAGNLRWVERFGGNNLDGVGDIAIDGAENIYVTGFFRGVADFGSETRDAGSGVDGFLASLDADGDWRWVRQIDGHVAHVTEGRGLEVIPGDEFAIPPQPGSVFVAGRWGRSVTFDHPVPADRISLSGSSTDFSRLFVARADTDGKWIWAVQGGSDGALASVLAADEAGRVAIGGTFFGSTTIGGTTLTAPSSAAFSDNFESGAGAWTITGSGSSTWGLTTALSRSPTHSFFIPDLVGIADRRLEMATAVSIPTSGGTLEFWHRFEFDEPTGSCYDGGVVEISADGGAWQDAGPYFTAGGYNGSLNGLESNPLGSRPAYCNTLGVFSRVELDVSAFGGQDVKVRFRFGAGTSFGGGGWYVDDLSIMAAQEAPFLARLSNALSTGPGWFPVEQLDEDLATLDDLALDENQNLYLAATSTGPACFPRSACASVEVSAAGAIVASRIFETATAWAWALGIPGGEAGGVSFDDDGNAFFSGTFSGTINGGVRLGDPELGLPLVSAGGTDLFVASLNPGGDWRWATRAGGPQDDSALGASFGAAALYVTGTFRGTSLDPAIFGDEPLIAEGEDDAFVANLDPDLGEWFDVQLWYAGQAVPAPSGADVTSSSATCLPEIFVDGQQITDGIPRLFWWSFNATSNGLSPPAPLGGRLHAMQPLDNVEIRWKVAGDSCNPTATARKISVGRTIWPTHPCPETTEGVCRQIHRAGSPVEVEVPGLALLATPRQPDVGASADAEIRLGVFNATNPGMSVLLYAKGDQTDFTQHWALPEVVQTVTPAEVVTAASTPLFVDNADCTVGERIVPPAFHNEAGRSGYVFNVGAFYDGVGPDAPYNRNARTGSIIPVNAVNPLIPDDEEMLVAWYHRGGAPLRDPEVATGVFWPEMSIRYNCRWPAINDRIVIASQFGSEVLGQEVLDPLQFPSMRVYNQPVRFQPNPETGAIERAPGFNPNDEHAIFAPSNTGSGVDALFALRSDFAEGPSHTDASEPYVLLKYQDVVTGEWRFKVYEVMATGAGFDGFRFTGKAGNPVFPPYPVSLLQACDETLVAGQTMPDDPVPPPFFKDYKNQVWGKSDGTGAALYYYPMQPTFFYDLDPDGITDDVNGDGTFGNEDGACIPWLARLDPVDGGTMDDDLPIAVEYEINWPDDVPILTIGETLLEPKKGLPDIFNQAAVKIVYDQLQDQVQQASIFDPTKTLARLIDPLNPRTIQLDALPETIATRLDLATGKRVVSGNTDGTIKLPSELRSRVTYDEQNDKLAFAGVFDGAGAGEPLLLLNVMTDRERKLLKRLDGGNGAEEEDFFGDCQDVADACTWDQAVEALYVRSRNPNVVDVGAECRIETIEFGFLGTTIIIPFPVCNLPGDGLPDRDLLIGLKNNGFVVEPAGVVGFKPALTAGFAQGTGYLTLAFNDDPSLNPLPVSLNVIRVDCLRSPEECTGPDCDILSTYQGEVDIIESDNTFDEQLTLRHSGDFAGRSDAVRFEWFYQFDEDGTPPTPLPDPEGGQLNGWLKFIPEGGELGGNSISIEGANLLTLADSWFVVRYEFPDGPGADGVSGTGDDAPLCAPGFGLFTGQPGSTPLAPRAQLSEGWIKRVIKGLNPFETRVKDFHAAATNTFASMLIQLGERYEGDIALNPAPDNLNQIGMIEAYETVLRRGIGLSIDGTPPINFGPANNALLLVASRIADFYTLLGNEAFADAQDPTVGISTLNPQTGFGSLAPTIFNFENQLSSVLEEELTLLRGRDDSQGPVAARPVYNRLFWNFTTGEGEVAYALSYNIADQNFDGVLDEFDAQIQYPQGHGDAWGHYLTALKTYYTLLQHPFFSWVARPEAITVAGVPIQVDFLDERKFAKTAAARARVGAETVDLTYRFNYVEDPAGQFQGYKDTDPERAWGLSGWARRAGQGAYFDWVVGNSILPDEDPNPEHVGIQRIDRTTVDELSEIITHYDSVQNQLDEADRGLNPLGLAKGVIPFDIDPARVDAGETHFEQILDRAEQALQNAVKVWDYANTLTRMLRFNQDTVDDQRVNARSTETDFKNQLIEVFGYPYDDDIGPGGIYPAGYDGPDLYHYMVVDAPELEGTNLDLNDPALNTIGRLNEYNADWGPMPNGVNFTNIEGEDLDLDCGSNAFNPGCSLGDLPDSKLSVTYTTWQHPDFGTVFVKNKGWTGNRRASGKIQDAQNEVVLAQINLKKAIAAHNKHLKDLECAFGGLQAAIRISNQELAIKNSATQRKAIWSTVNAGLDGASIVAQRVKSIASNGLTSAEKCVPDSIVVGLAGGGDIFAGVSCALVAARTGIDAAFDLAGDAIALSKIAEQQTDNIKGLSSALKFDVLGKGLEFFNEKGAIEAMVRQEPVLRAEMFARKQALQQSFQKYTNALAEGQRILASLVSFRKDGAAAVQEQRYQDMAFRIFRNDALQKYRAQFDMAARYTYLAAAAYDFETNLLNTDAQAGQEFLTSIVKERSIGQVVGGRAVPGSRGLADPLGRMEANFEVLKGQMGFNNPQIENNRFSMRRELFRIDDGPEGDEKWRDFLEEHRVDDLWQVDEFRRFARPFAPESLGSQPGLVIPFESTVTFSLNFFGWPLGPGDSYYDASNFATRVRGAGVWFDGYGELPLANTPRVYLIPAGADVMRAPAANDFKTREWGVVDQLLPVPFPIGDADLSNPDWLPLADSLSGSFDTIRRYASFRAYDFSDVLEDSEFTTDSRLIGRSVWNNNWVLIIPGGNLLFDANEGLDTFISGNEIPGSEGERDGNGVDDILFFFKTYAYSGF